MKNIRDDIVFSQSLKDMRLTFHSTWGLFSPKQIDEGSVLLLEAISPGTHDLCLDLGCGYGALGLPLAKRSPQGTVHMIDKDFVAIEYAKKNAAMNAIKNVEIYLSNGFSHVPALKFDHVVSNVPAKVGKELYEIIISDAKRHLKPGGVISLVFVSHLKEYFKRTFTELFGNYQVVAHNKTYIVLHAINQ